MIKTENGLHKYEPTDKADLCGCHNENTDILDAFISDVKDGKMDAATLGGKSAEYYELHDYELACDGVVYPTLPNGIKNSISNNIYTKNVGRIAPVKKIQGYSGAKTFLGVLSTDAKLTNNGSVANALCSKLEVVSSNSQYNNGGTNISVSNQGYLIISFDGITTESAFDTRLASELLTIYYELEKPITKNVLDTQLDLLSNISNPALNINPNFAINQRNGYYAPQGITCYTDSACTTNPSALTTNYTAYRYSDTVMYIIPPNNTTYYVKTSDCKKGYVETSAININCFDGWKLQQATVTKLDKGINFKSSSKYGKVNGYIENYDDYKGKTVTLSCKVSNASNGLFLQLTDGINGGVSSVKNGLVTITKTINENPTQLQYVLYNNNETGTEVNADIEYIKLELSTVATPLSPLKPSEALSECQYYLYMVLKRAMHFQVAEINGGTLVFYIQLENVRDVVPTLIGTPNSTNVGGYSVRKGGQLVDGFTFEIAKIGNGVRVVGRKENHGLTFADNIKLEFTVGTGFSFEL